MSSLPNYSDEIPKEFLSKKVSDLIQSILEEMYRDYIGQIDEPPCKTREGFLNIFPVDENTSWSILNFFYSNRKMRNKMYRFFVKSILRSLPPREQTVDNFMEWMKENKEILFGEEGDTAKQLRDVVWSTSARGFELEKSTLQRLKKAYNTLTDDRIKVFCKGSPEDEKEGIDFMVDGKGFQIKQLVGATQINGKWEITTIGMKQYPSTRLNFMVYSNDNKILIFLNQNSETISRQGDRYVIRYDKPPVREC
jgi:hypothetical protein